MAKLRQALDRCNMERQPTRTEKRRFVRTYIGDPAVVVERVLKVVQHHMKLDDMAFEACNALSVAALKPGDIGYPLITMAVLAVVKNQLVHIRNGCLSDDFTSLPYVSVGEVDFRNSGFKLPAYKSLRGTSKVEAVHSLMAKQFRLYNGMQVQVYNARLTWNLLAYNRRILQKAGEKQPAAFLSPDEIERRGGAAVYPDWRSVPKGT